MIGAALSHEQCWAVIGAELSLLRPELHFCHLGAGFDTSPSKQRTEIINTGYIELAPGPRHYSEHNHSFSTKIDI